MEGREIGARYKYDGGLLLVYQVAVSLIASLTWIYLTEHNLFHWNVNILYSTEMDRSFSLQVR